ncbi:saposin A [Heterostelium album PN500]|uniref:Saposin A n=1 Tax=Heterostelium pallidum (strain ATCC 26659 / Pp 5 / PN500) TaxID=670386 RepID=D3BRD5_HETP5|nr:saposin A [Heterostelium album PN500]EFA75967.1 saposin A [Heterostelium album PN500]|eukprot:XP_020428101.1 saposin A [Heterostelium album PN500]
MKYIPTLLLLLVTLSFYQVQANMDCEICTFLVGYAERYVESNKSISDIETSLNAVCDIFGDKEKATCQVMVDSYTPLIVNMILNKESASTICNQMKACTSKDSVEFLIRDEIECSLCSYVVSRVEGYFEGKLNETEIMSRLDDDCKFLDEPTIVDACTTLINEYGPLIISSIESGVEPQTVCTEIKVCDPSTSKKHININIINIQEPTVVVEEQIVGGVYCPICTMVASYTEEYLASNKTETEIIKLIKNDCLMIEKTWTAQCQAIASNYVPQMIEWFEREQTPSVVCKNLGYC